MRSLMSILILRGFPGGVSGKELDSKCRRCKRCRFNLWILKIPWRRARQPMLPVFLPGEPHGQRNLAGYMLILMRGNKSNNLEDWLVNTESESQELDNLVLLKLEVWNSLKRYLLDNSNILGFELKFLLKYRILEKALLIFVCLLTSFLCLCY